MNRSSGFTAPVSRCRESGRNSQACLNERAMGSGTTRDAVSGWLKRHPRIRKAIRFVPSLAKRARTKPGTDYPAQLSVHGANNTTIDFVSSTSVTCIAEIGIYEGDTSVHFAKHLG